jgi:peptidoglycan-N-acetylglucosamine deacetylase
MNLSTEIIISIIFVFLIADFTLILVILYNKRKKNLTKKDNITINKYIVDEIENISELEKIKRKISSVAKSESLAAMMSLNKKRIEKIKDKKRSFNQFVNYLQPVSLNNEIKIKLLDYFREYNVDKYYLKKLSSVFKVKRMESSIYLGYFPTNDSINALHRALEKEKKYVVRLYISSALANIGDEKSIPVIVNTLIGSPEWYREKIQVLLTEFSEKFYNYIPFIKDRQEVEIQSLIIYFSSCFVNIDLKNYLIQKSESSDVHISRSAVISLLKSYYIELNNEKFLDNEDEFIRHTAILALGKIQTTDSIKRLLEFLNEPVSAMYAVSSISEILRKEPKFLSHIIKCFYEETGESRKRYLANILSNRIEYFLFNLQT